MIVDEVIGYRPYVEYYECGALRVFSPSLPMRPWEVAGRITGGNGYISNGEFETFTLRADSERIVHIRMWEEEWASCEAWIQAWYQYGEDFYFTFDRDNDPSGTRVQCRLIEPAMDQFSAPRIDFEPALVFDAKIRRIGGSPFPTAFWP